MKILDWLGERLSDGIYAIETILRWIGGLLTITLGSVALILFTLILSPLMFLGWICRKTGMTRERWGEH